MRSIKSGFGISSIFVTSIHLLTRKPNKYGYFAKSCGQRDNQIHSTDWQPMPYHFILRCGTTNYLQPLA